MEAGGPLNLGPGGGASTHPLLGGARQLGYFGLENGKDAPTVTPAGAQAQGAKVGCTGHVGGASSAASLGLNLPVWKAGALGGVQGGDDGELPLCTAHTKGAMASCHHFGGPQGGPLAESALVTPFHRMTSPLVWSP